NMGRVHPSCVHIARSNTAGSIDRAEKFCRPNSDRHTHRRSGGWRILFCATARNVSIPRPDDREAGEFARMAIARANWRDIRPDDSRALLATPWSDRMLRFDDPFADFE